MIYNKQETLLKLDNISLKYQNKQILRDINISIENITRSTHTTGQVTTLLGRSGSGKSTLFKVIAGLIQPTTGNVIINSENVKPGVVGMVLQTYPLLHHRTVISNMTLVCKDKSKVEEYLHQFDIWEHKAKYPKQLSGGQRQRAAIVQQLLCSEHFTLLDEPFSGLDPVATEKLCNVINKVANMHDKNTVIISSHILEPSIAISDSIWVLGKKDGMESSTIVYTEDLASQGLAWDPDIRRKPLFTEKIEQIRSIFHTI